MEKIFKTSVQTGKSRISDRDQNNEIQSKKREKGKETTFFKTFFQSICFSNNRIRLYEPIFATNGSISAKLTRLSKLQSAVNQYLLGLAAA